MQEEDVWTGDEPFNDGGDINVFAPELYRDASPGPVSGAIPTAMGVILTDDHLHQYHDAVQSFIAGFFQVEDKIYVVEGWDPERGRTMVSSLSLAPNRVRLVDTHIGCLVSLAVLAEGRQHRDGLYLPSRD